jgi:hypothetical protein
MSTTRSITISLGPAPEQLRGLVTVSRRQRPPAMLDGLAPACARARPLASTIRHPNPRTCSVADPSPRPRRDLTQTATRARTARVAYGGAPTLAERSLARTLG